MARVSYDVDPDPAEPHEVRAIPPQEVHIPEAPKSVLEGGAVKMMQPGDPSAPARHTINCGCASVPVVPKDNPYGIRRTIVDEIADNDAAENARARAVVRNAARQG